MSTRGSGSRARMSATRWSIPREKRSTGVSAHSVSPKRARRRSGLELEGDPTENGATLEALLDVARAERHAGGSADPARRFLGEQSLEPPLEILTYQGMGLAGELAAFEPLVERRDQEKVGLPEIGVARGRARRRGQRQRAHGRRRARGGLGGGRSPARGGLGSPRRAPGPRRGAGCSAGALAASGRDPE